VKENFKSMFIGDKHRARMTLITNAKTKDLEINAIPGIKHHPNVMITRGKDLQESRK